MNIYRYPLSISLPLLIAAACAVIGAVAIIYLYDASQKDVIEDEKYVALTLANITASQLDYHLRQGDQHEARNTLDRLKADRNLIEAALLDDQQRILFSSQGQLEGGDVGDFGPTIQSALEEAGWSGLSSVAQILGTPPSSLVLTPVNLAPGIDELSSTRFGVLLLQRDLLPSLQKQRANFRNTTILVIVAILALSLGVWLILRNLLFDRMNLILAGLGPEEATFMPPARLKGRDELSTIADGFHRFTINLKRNIDKRLASEQRFRTLFEQSAVGMARIATSGNLLDVNDKACSMLGYDTNELLQLRVQDIIYPDDLTEDLKLHKHPDENNPLEFSTECRCVTRNRSIIWVNVSISAVRYDAGGVDHYICVLQDISDSVAGRHRLLRAQAVGGIGSWEGDISDGRLTWSDEALKIIGLRRNEFGGTADAFFSLVHAEDRQRYQAVRQKWLQNGGEFNLRYRILRPDGDERWVHERALLRKDGEAIHASHFGTIQDVTDRVLAEQELERRQNFLASVLESSGAGIVVCNHEGKVTTFNRIARSWHQKDAESVDSSQWPTVYDLYRDDGVTPLDTQEVPLWRAYNGETISHFEMVIAPPGGPRRSVISTAVPVLDGEGRKLGAVVSMLDITDRRNAEQALRESHQKLETRVRDRTRSLQQANAKLRELDHLKSMFIASMSHELRTPLNSIIGFSAMLLQEIPGPVNDKQHDYLQRISGSGKHLLSLITDVIDIAKLEAGKVEVHIEEVDLSALVEEVARQFRIQAHDKGLELRTRVEEGVCIVSDRRKVMQCILNYVSNALKYTLQGTIEVQLSVLPDTAGRVEISVIDSGVGIAAADQAKLFKQFSRIDSELTRATPGTGLGLYLTHKMATEILGGSVSVASTPGEGSVFRLHLPQAVPS